MSNRYYFAFLAVLGLAACDTAPPTIAPVTFTQVSAANAALFEPLGERKGWGAISRAEEAENRGIHRLIRIGPDAEEEQRAKVVRQCVLSFGGTVLAAERTTFADGDVGLLVTCSQ